MIRRPLMYAASACAAAILSSYCLGMFWAFVPVAVFLVVLISMNCGCKDNRAGRRNLVLLILLCYLFSLVNYSFKQNAADGIMPYVGKHVETEGKIISVENRETMAGDPFTQFKFDVEKINGAPLKRKARILIKQYSHKKYGAGNYSQKQNNSQNRNIRELNLIPGQRAVVKGEPELPTGRRNPNCFDYSLYLRSTGIHVTMTADSVQVGEELTNTFQGRLYLIKERFLSKMKAETGKETVAVMRALMFGEKSELDEERLEEFQKNGTAHILAVSGLHIGIIYGFICLLWRWKKGWLFFILVMSFFVCYMILASFSPSVVRAVSMVGLHIFSKITNRRYDLSSAAFLVVMVMLFKNPYAIFNAGFQMSFLAVLTLALILPLVKRIYSGIFVGSAAIQIGLLPYTTYTFNYLPLSAVLVNVPLIFLTGIIIPLGLCSMILMELSPPLFELSTKLIFGLCEMLQDVNAMTGIDGKTVFQVTSPGIGWLAFYYLSLPVFVSEEGRLLFLRKKRKSLALLAIAVLIVSFSFAKITDDGFDDTDMVFVDVGQGDCMHIKTQEGMNYLIDGGGSTNYNIGKKTLKPYLLKNGVRSVDGAFVTHLHSDHYQGIAELCREGMVEKLFLYEGYCVKEEQVLKETGLAKEDLVYLYRGQKVSLGKGASAEVLWPQRQGQGQYIKAAENEEDENISSLILMVYINGHSMTATGDVDEDCQDKLAQMWRTKLKADVLKVAHHGSKYSYSEGFVRMTDPGYAVFQVGKNNFGHPNEDVVAKYRSKGITVYRNDTDGAIGFDFKENGDVEIVTMISQHITDDGAKRK